MSEPEQNDLTENTGKKNPLKLNRFFAKNIIKFTQDNNHRTATNQLNQQRKFVNEERKKHTKKNLSDGTQKNKTMYCDYVSEKLEEKTARKTSVMFDQMKKLVKEAAEFDEVMSQKEIQNLHGTYLGGVQRRKPKVSVDKTLLRNHLQHTSVHNRLKEESQMWDKLDKEKKRHTTRQPYSSKVRSGMYADSEPGKSITVQLKTDESSDVVTSPPPKTKLERSSFKLSSKKKITGMYSDNTRREMDDDHKISDDPEPATQRRGRIVRKVSNRKVLIDDAHDNEIPHIELKSLSKRKREHQEERLTAKKNITTKSLYADASEVSPSQSASKKGDKWGHDGFYSLDDNEGKGGKKKKNKESAPVYRITSGDDDLDVEKNPTPKRLSSKIIKKGEGHFVSRDTLRGSLHHDNAIEHKSKSVKPRLVLSTKNSKRKQRKYSSSSSSLSSSGSSSSSSSSGSESDSSFSSSGSSEDSRTRHVPKKKSKRTKKIVKRKKSRR